MPKRKSYNGQSFSSLAEYMRSLNINEDKVLEKIKTKSTRISAEKVSAIPSGSETLPGGEQLDKVVAELKAIDNTLKTDVVGGLSKISNSLTGGATKATDSLKNAVTKTVPVIGGDIKNTYGSIKETINNKQQNTSISTVSAITNDRNTAINTESNSSLNSTSVIPSPHTGEERLHNSEVNNIKQVEVKNIVTRKEKDTEDNKLKVSSKRESEVSEKALARDNPNADNMESSNEKMVKVSMGIHQAIGELIGVSKSQLSALNNIKDSIAPSGASSPQGTSSTITSKPTTPAAAEPAPAPATAGPGLADLASVIPSGGGGSSTKLPEAKKSLGSKVLGGLKGVGKVLGKFALPVALGMSAMDATEGYQKANENLDIQGREATKGEKLSSGAGSAVSGLTFGMLDAKTASKGIHSIGSSVGDLYNSAKSAVGKTFDKGKELINETVQGMDLARQAVGGGPNGTVINNSVSTNNSTKYVPIKSSPRPESQGSALDRYQNRITSF